MIAKQFRAITNQYRRLRIAVVGDFCLDRYLEIDPARKEISLETGLPVYNVVNVRGQPGAAGTVLNNLVALGIGTLYPVGFRGCDGEGSELERALLGLRGVSLKYFFATTERRTFTYAKPLLMHRGKPPEELNRLDSKNWTPTPATVRKRIVSALRALQSKVDAIIVLDQVDIPETGVVTREVLAALKAVSAAHPDMPILADSRQRLQSFPPLNFKMNAVELTRFLKGKPAKGVEQIQALAATLARRNRRAVFVTLAERGMIGALPSGEVAHVASLPLRGPIDIVGAGDSVTANLTAALAGGAALREALEIASIGASVVIHQLGTTGTASVRQIGALLGAVGSAQP